MNILVAQQKSILFRFFNCLNIGTRNNYEMIQKKNLFFKTYFLIFFSLYILYFQLLNIYAFEKLRKKKKDDL